MTFPLNSGRFMTLPASAAHLLRLGRRHAGAISAFAMIFSAIILCFAVSPSATAQVNSATLRGTVTDATGAIVEGASVSVESKATNAVRTTLTNGAGEYSISSLQPGLYFIKVTKTGFSTFQQNDFSLEVGAVASVDVALKLGSYEAR